MERIITFPKGFLWGASTSSYQTEGGNTRSAIWDWEKRKNWERSGEANGSWDKFEEDIKCLKALHCNAYRFAVEWSRVQPEPDVFDEVALARYADWARRLSEEGIRPFVCFHHFSEPAWLLKRHPAGWLEPGVSQRFLKYVEKTASALKPWVKDWVVFNEPMVFLIGCYGMGQFPPGRWMLTDVRKLFLPVLVANFAAAVREASRLLHGLQPEARVGLAHHVSALEPAAPGDEKAVQDWDWFMHRNFLDLTVSELDFMGINYYTRIFIHKSPIPWTPLGIIPGYAEFEHKVTRPVFRMLGGRRGECPRSGMDWEIVPEGFGRVVHDLWNEYRKPVYILENGLADQTGELRESFISSHLESLAQAMEKGADVRGYFHWSLLDNYEWGSYRPRFGLFSRDRKPSGGSQYYARVASTGELSVHG